MLKGYRFRIRGIVQGVGFRPFLYRLAAKHRLNGSVWNDVDGVVLCLESEADTLERFWRDFHAQIPPLARVDNTTEEPGEPIHIHTPFRILPSDTEATLPSVPISPDTAPCVECLRELHDPDDRRFRYPFLNCTNCGPRLTIIEGVPYDRSRTTMARFPLCESCETEYLDPTNRRFHAQPTACPQCGPRLWIEPAPAPPAPPAPSLGPSESSSPSDSHSGSPTAPNQPTDPILTAAQMLRDGKIVAIKGIGGFHLTCDATNETAVETLRDRKLRDDKPFAIMVSSVREAEAYVSLSPASRHALTHVARPIVLCPKRKEVEAEPLSDGLAEGLVELGVMLPSSPIHVLLLEAVDRPLVMTSGNLSDEPLVYQNAAALRDLQSVADAFLLHDRGIVIRCDDSIVRETQVLRRARGYVPTAYSTPFASASCTLAVGAELKSTISVTRGSEILTSHHLADLDHTAAYFSFERLAETWGDLFGVTPATVVHDLHPEYRSTKFATELGLPALGIQHHHAHAVSCMVDNDFYDPILALAFDGHGWGTDDTLWGGELLYVTPTHFERLAHLPEVGLPGGEKAAREPWRMAVAWLGSVSGDDAVKYFARDFEFDYRWPEILTLSHAPRTMRTSSMGRLFDAVSYFVTRRSVMTYEGQAARELEALARRSTGTFHFDLDASTDGDLVLKPLFTGILGACVEGRDPGDIAYAFHHAIATLSADLAHTYAQRLGIPHVALTGGVFQNALLTELTSNALRARGLKPILHRRVPPNDGGISVGQAAIALAMAQSLP